MYGHKTESFGRLSAFSRSTTEDRNKPPTSVGGSWLDIFTNDKEAKAYLKDFAKKQRIPEHRLTIKTHSPLDLNV